MCKEAYRGAWGPQAGKSGDLDPWCCGVRGGWWAVGAARTTTGSLCLMGWCLQGTGPSAYSTVQWLYHRENHFGPPCSVLPHLFGEDNFIFLTLKEIFLNGVALTSTEGYYKLLGHIWSIQCGCSGFKNQIIVSF